MFTCGSGEVALDERRAAGLLRDVGGGPGHQLHQPLRAGRGGLVEEVRLGVDDAGDQSGVEALVGGLLADHVLVAQRQLDLLHGLVGPRRDDRGDDERDDRDRREKAEPASARAARRGRFAACARDLYGWRCSCSSVGQAQLLKNVGQFTLQRARSRSLRTTWSARAAFSSWVSWRAVRSSTAHGHALRRVPRGSPRPRSRPE